MLKIWNDLFMLGIESQQVIWLRSMKLAMGGKGPYSLWLLRIVDRVGTKSVVMVDGGFHRGTDLVKAIALGARFVLIGRPFLYAVATAGLLGILKAANILQTEINRDMALFGLSAIEDISSECLVPRAPPALCSPL